MHARNLRVLHFSQHHLFASKHLGVAKIPFESFRLTQMVLTVGMEYLPRFLKKPKRMSARTGAQLVNELLHGHEEVAYEHIRMSIYAFRDLCTWFQEHGLLFDSEGVNVEEQVAIFLYIVGQGVTNQNAQHEFQHSGETITQYIF